MDHYRDFFNFQDDPINFETKNLIQLHGSFHAKVFNWFFDFLQIFGEAKILNPVFFKSTHYPLI